ncbi:MAG: glycoside hydrolase family 2 TIM barrel-domain containing protein [Armatimonadota bacterium]
MKSVRLFPVLAAVLLIWSSSDAATNLALTSHATAQSIYRNMPEMVASKAVDGSMETRWGAEERGHWLQLEWDNPQTICGVVMRNYDEVWNRNRPYTVQVWDDSLHGGTGGFRDVITMQSRRADVLFRFPSVTTTRLRVTNAITLWELEVYNDLEVLDSMIDEQNRIYVTAAGDSRSRLVGTVSSDHGVIPVEGSDVFIEGTSPCGAWNRTAKTNPQGLFIVDLPLGIQGNVQVTAKTGDSTAKYSIDAGDISYALTPRIGKKGNHLSMEGAWEIAMDPPDGFPKSGQVQWKPVTVPSHWEMSGFVAETGQAVYRKTLGIPAGWAGKRIKFRSDGIYSQCQVWVNNRQIGGHDGGVTPFELDITDAAKPGEQNTIIILVKDKSDAGQFDAMSYYAHINMGGIWRPVELFCVEPAHISRFALETHLIESGDDELLVNVDISNEQDTPVRDAKLALSLRDPDGRLVKVEGLAARVSLDAWEKKTFTLRAKVKSPKEWSAESPSLYTLTAKFASSTIEQKFGFKEVKIDNRSFTFNGKRVKLWGACRHDADPVNGRAISIKTARQDIELMKGANLNAMRTSHYPPHPEALNAADELGIYVEDEAPNCFVGVWYGPPTEGRDFVNDLRLAPLCISLASAMVERDRNHPSVVIWSVCNESVYGQILDVTRAFIKDSDPTRPISAGQSANLDIATYHNPTSMQRLKDTADFTMPVLFDEGFAIFQGFGYQADGLDVDPGLRDFWVTAHPEPIEGLWKSEHQFGSMIWAWADDAFQVPGKGIEYGRRNLPRTHFVDDLYWKPGFGIVGDPMWGVVDGWRRPRPEWWLCKKLFSPVRIEEKPLKPGTNLSVEVENRNFFIGLDQYLCKWRIGERHGELRPNIPALSKGMIEIPVGGIPGADEVLMLEFIDKSGRLVDGYKLKIDSHPTKASIAVYKPARLLNQQGNLDFGNAVRMIGTDTELAFDRSGSLIRGLAGRRQVLLAGPELHMMKSYAQLEVFPAGWRFTGDTSGVEDGWAALNWNGQYGDDLSGGYNIRMDDAGQVEICYDFTYKGSQVPVREVGLSFELPVSCDKLEWDRKAEWSYYPDDHIGRPHGIAIAHPKVDQKMPPGRRPFGLDDHPWGCNDFRSTKRNIRWASLTDDAGFGVKILSDGSQHIRAAVGVRSIKLTVMDYYGGSATGTPEWDGAYGIGRVINPGDKIEGVIRLQLLSGR